MAILHKISRILRSKPAASGLEDKIGASLNARKVMQNDFFGGWCPADIDLLSRYKVDLSREMPVDGIIIDWLGVKTKKKNHPWMGSLEVGCVFPNLPIPDDSVHAEAIEYTALVVALERSIAARKGSEFVVLELGASYAPWATTAALLALRSGFGKIHATAVEASASSIASIREHASLNGLLQRDDVEFKCIHGAVYCNNETLFFHELIRQSTMALRLWRLKMPQIIEE